MKSPISIIEKIIKQQREYLKLYRQSHTSFGCRATHMLGIPMIMATPLGPAYLLFNGHWSLDTGTAVMLGASAACFVVGWILQFAGHKVFEKNDPVFLKNPLNLYNYTSAVIFVAEEWGRLVTLGKARVQVQSSTES